MFGETIDYHLLRPFCRRSISAEHGATETNRGKQEVSQQLESFLRYFGGRLNLQNLVVLDLGCGHGELALEIARHGAAAVCGVDMVPGCIETARGRLAGETETIRDKIEFIQADFLSWQSPRQFDIIISRAAFEHIDQAEETLQKIYALLKPGGCFATVFGPMFHSPFGDHMWGFFRRQIPYRGVLFNEQAILRLRREFFRPDEHATRYQEIKGGLNCLRFSEFARFARNTGGQIEMLQLNVKPQRRKFLRALWYPFSFLQKAGYLADYFAMAPLLLLRKPQH